MDTKPQINQLEGYLAETKVFPMFQHYKRELEECPAGTFHHHNFRGGLVRHMLEMIRFGSPIVNSLVREGQKLIDYHEFLVAVFLHDLAKLEFYQASGDLTYSYVKHDHVLQEMMVQNMCAKFGIVLSENEMNALWLAEGAYSPVHGEVQATPLATLLHMCDLYSALLIKPQLLPNAGCPKCLTEGRENGNLVQRSGTKGTFWGCSNYPDCRHTQNEDPELQLVDTFIEGK